MAARVKTGRKRIDLVATPEFTELLKAGADKRRLSLCAYVRQAVMAQLVRDRVPGARPG